MSFQLLIMHLGRLKFTSIIIIIIIVNDLNLLLLLNLIIYIMYSQGHTRNVALHAVMWRH